MAMARPAARPRPPGDFHRRHRAQRSKTTGRSPVTSPAPLHRLWGCPATVSATILTTVGWQRAGEGATLGPACSPRFPLRGEEPIFHR